MIRIVLALVMAGWRSAARPAPSPASAAPRLKELVTVSSEIVRIGDLVENAGIAADVPVFRAPDLGQTGAVPISRDRRRAAALRHHRTRHRRAQRGGGDAAVAAR